MLYKLLLFEKITERFHLVKQSVAAGAGKSSLENKFAEIIVFLKPVVALNVLAF